MSKWAVHANVDAVITNNCICIFILRLSLLDNRICIMRLLPSICGVIVVINRYPHIR
jgi:hypothetical protein